MSIRALQQLFLLLTFVVSNGAANEQATQIKADKNEPRIVAVGDVHGDYNQLVKLLRSVGLIDKRRKWVGGNAQLVQMGDLTGRGPNSRLAIDLLHALQTQAQKAGGAVHLLIGNHEAMNVIGDLRYVHPGEYKAFRTANSKRSQQAYFQHTVKTLTERSIAQQTQLPSFDKAYKEAWQAKFPLGYVEHRLAWQPTGDYGRWVLSNFAVKRLGRTLFTHGGISEKYADMTISEINTRIRTELLDATNLSKTSIVEDEDGPLWYRGWATLNEDSASEALLNKILTNFDVDRLVVAHSPVIPGVLPRFGGRVLLVDVGLAEHYGNGFAALEIIDDKLTALHGREQIEIPNSSNEVPVYLETLSSIVNDPDKSEKVQRYRQRLIQRLDLQPKQQQVQQAQ